MRLFVDLDLLQLIEAPGVRQPVTRIRAKRGTSKVLELQFVRNGESVLLPTGTQIRFGPKETGKYDGAFVVFCDTFTEPEDATGYYVGFASFNTGPLNTLLGSPDGTTTNDKESVDLMVEFSWLVPGATLPEKCDTITVTVSNAVDNGDEAAPSEAGPSLNTRLTAVEAGKQPLSTLLTNLVADSATVSLTLASLALVGDLTVNGTLTAPGLAISGGGLITSCGGITFIGDGVDNTLLELGAIDGVWPVARGGTGRSTKPFCSVRRAASLQLFVSSVDTKVILDTKETDPDNIWSTANSRVTMPRAGFVLFTVSLIADFGGWYLRLKKNGTTNIQLHAQEEYAVDSFAIQMPVAQGDYFELWAQQPSTDRYIYGGTEGTKLAVSYID